VLGFKSNCERLRSGAWPTAGSTVEPDKAVHESATILERS
jgi:hypothetical protein